ncbi:unnamed protein product [Brassica rapa]|uniref:Uncharacterized protein n=1 Tax=Brassica campestris TaxID=3711 RepID=A0A8D9MDG8_BRACM|nr:unnamed protein product [Brassica rapa]
MMQSPSTKYGGKFFQVVLLYSKTKLHAIYNNKRVVSLHDSLWGTYDQGFDEADFFT